MLYRHPVQAGAAVPSIGTVHVPGRSRHEFPAAGSAAAGHKKAPRPALYHRPSGRSLRRHRGRSGAPHRRLPHHGSVLLLHGGPVRHGRGRDSGSHGGLRPRDSAGAPDCPGRLLPGICGEGKAEPYDRHRRPAQRQGRLCRGPITQNHVQGRFLRHPPAGRKRAGGRHHLGKPVRILSESSARKPRIPFLCWLGPTGAGGPASDPHFLRPGSAAHGPSASVRLP